MLAVLIIGGRGAWRSGAAAKATRCSAARAASSADAAAVDSCQSLEKHGHRSEAQACFRALVRASNPYLRAEGYWGLHEYSQANEEFRAAVAQADGNASYRVRWGRMLHERFNDQDAQDLFKEALQRDPNNAQAYLGLALVSADGFDNGAIEWAQQGARSSIRS